MQTAFISNLKSAAAAGTEMPATVYVPVKCLFVELNFLAHVKWRSSLFIESFRSKTNSKLFNSLRGGKRNAEQTHRNNTRVVFFSFSHSWHVCKSFTLKDSIYWFEFFFDELFCLRKKGEEKNQITTSTKKKHVHTRTLSYFL